MDTPYLEKAYELSKELTSAKNFKDLFDTIADHLPRMLNAKYCSLFIRNPASGELEIKAHNHEDIGADPFINIASEADSVMNLAIQRNSSMIVNDIQDEIGIDNKDKYSSKSFMCILLKDSENIHGVINLADKQSGVFQKEDMLIASILGDVLGTLIPRSNITKL